MTGSSTDEGCVESPSFPWQEILSYGKSQDFVSRSLSHIEECFSRMENHFDRMVVSFNGGKDCTVLLYLVAAVRIRKESVKSSLKCLYILPSNDDQISETFPEIDSFISQMTSYIPNLELVKLCGPSKHALSLLKTNVPSVEAIFMGTRKSDLTGGREMLVFQATDSDWPPFLRVNPILEWSYHDVWKFLLDLKLPYCSLYDQGYTSIGSVSDTQVNPKLVTPSGTLLPAHMLTDSDDERAGRIAC